MKSNFENTSPYRLREYANLMREELLRIWRNELIAENKVKAIKIILDQFDFNDPESGFLCCMKISDIIRDFQREEKSSGTIQTLDYVFEELKRQEEIYGDLSHSEWIAILFKQLGELNHIFLNPRKDHKEAKQWAIQIAASAFRLIMDICEKENCNNDSKRF